MRKVLVITFLVLAPLFPGLSAEEGQLRIRRVLMDSAQLPADVQQQKELVRIERDRFEEVVRQANEISRAGKHPPRLLEARYQAVLDDGQLVGNGEWKIANPYPIGGLLPFDPWNLALGPKPTVNNIPAVVGELIGKTPGLVVDGTGTQVFRFQWSARGERKPEGWQFDLQMPAAPLAVLEVSLASHLQLIGAETPSGDPTEKKRWQLVFGGQAHLGFWIRPVSDAGKPGFLTARQQAHYDVNASRIDARFEFDLESYHGTREQFQLDFPSALEPTSVTFRQQAVRWQMTTEKERRMLTVHLPEPFQGRGGLLIACDGGSTVLDSRFPFPLLHLRKAVRQRESVVVRSSPEINLADWDFGDFRPAIQPELKKEDGETITLRHDGIGGNTERTASARVRLPTQPIRVEQDAWWHIKPEESFLRWTASWQALSGAVHQLPMEIPLDWRVERVELSSPELLDHWQVQRKGRVQELDIRLKRSVSTAVRVTLELRPIHRQLINKDRVRLPIPRIMPRGAVRLQSQLAITVDHLRAWVDIPNGRETSSPQRPASVGAARVPDFHLTFTGREPEGFIELEPSASPTSSDVSTISKAKEKEIPGSIFSTIIDPTETVVESALLRGYADPSGTIFFHYQCLLHGPPGTEPAFRLPVGAHLVRMSMDGETVSTSASRTRVFLKKRSATLELLWTMENEGSRWWSRLAMDPMEWEAPTRVLSSNRVWLLPSKWVSLHSDWRRTNDNAVGDKSEISPTDSWISRFLPEQTAGWSVWESANFADEPSALIAIDSRALQFAAVVLALLLLSTAWSFRGDRRRWRMLVGSIWFGCILILWLPESLRFVVLWPTLSAAAVALIGFLSRWLDGRPKEVSPMNGRMWLLGLVGFGSILSVTLAQPSLVGVDAPISTVYLFPGPADKPQQSYVLAPNRLWSQLQELAQGRTHRLPTHTVVDADYAVTVTGLKTALEATFLVEVFREEKVHVTLPLSNVRLQSALLDGAPVLVAPLKQADGFQIEVSGKGRHAIQLAVETSPTVRGEENEIRCKVPSVAASRLTLKVLGKARAMQAVNILGSQWAAINEGDSVLRADMGAVSELHIRWWGDGSGSPQVHVEEAYLWDFHGSEATLWGVLHYEILRGAEDQLRVRLPIGLEVKTVEVKADGNTERPPRLQDWHVLRQGALSELVISLRQPVVGSLRVHLEMPARTEVMRSIIKQLHADACLSAVSVGRLFPSPTVLSLDVDSLSTSATWLDLGLPTPLEAERKEGLFALNVDEITIDGVQASPEFNEGELEPFLEIWPVDFGNTEHLIAHYQFQTVGEPRFALKIRPTPTDMAVHQNISMHVEGKEIQVSAAVDVSLSNPPISMLTVEASPMLADWHVDGDDVLKWTREGSNIQVWFKRPIEQSTSFHVAGRRGATTTTVDLPRLTLMDHAGRIPTNQTVRLSLTRSEPAIVQTQDLRGAKELTGPFDNEHVRMELESDRSDYRGTLLISPEPQVFTTQATLHLARVGDAVEARWAIACRVEQGRLRTLILHLPHASADQWQIKDADAIRVRKQPLSPVGRQFEVEFRKAVDDRADVILMGPVAFGDAQEFIVPQVVPQGARMVEHRVGPLPIGITAEPADPKVPGSSLRFRMDSLPKTAEPPRVIVAEYETKLGDGGRLLHSAVYSLRQGRAIDWRVQLKDDRAHLRRVWVNQQEVGFEKKADGEHRIALPLSADWRQVQLTWEVEPASRWPEMKFIPPNVASKDSFPVVWTVHLPLGWEETSSPSSRDLARAHQELIRAKANLEYLRWLLEKFQSPPPRTSDDQIIEAQTDFYRRLRRIADLAPSKDGADLRGKSAVLRRANEELTTNADWESLRRRGADAAVSAAKESSKLSKRTTDDTRSVYFSFDQSPDEFTASFRSMRSGESRRTLLWTIGLTLLASAGLLIGRRRSDAPPGLGL